jgi:hypothetical protein
LTSFSFFIQSSCPPKKKMVLKRTIRLTPRQAAAKVAHSFVRAGNEHLNAHAKSFAILVRYRGNVLKPFGYNALKGAGFVIANMRAIHGRLRGVMRDISIFNGLPQLDMAAINAEAEVLHETIRATMLAKRQAAAVAKANGPPLAATRRVAPPVARAPIGAEAPRATIPVVATAPIRMLAPRADGPPVPHRLAVPVVRVPIGGVAPRVTVPVVASATTWQTIVAANQPMNEPSSSSTSPSSILGRRGRQPVVTSTFVPEVGDVVYLNAPNQTLTFQVEITNVDVQSATASFTYCDPEYVLYGEQTRALAYFTSDEPARRSRRRSALLENYEVDDERE